MNKVLLILRKLDLGAPSDWVPSRIVELPDWVKNAERGCEESAVREFTEREVAAEQERMVRQFPEFRNARFEGTVMEVYRGF